MVGVSVSTFSSGQTAAFGASRQTVAWHVEDIAIAGTVHTSKAIIQACSNDYCNGLFTHVAQLLNIGHSGFYELENESFVTNIVLDYL